MSNNVTNTSSTEASNIRHHDPPPPYTEIASVPVQQIVIVPPELKDQPVLYNCPACKEMCLTRVQFVNTTKTHMIAGFIGGLTFWCMLCCLAAVPYMLPTFKKAEHYCSNCDTHLGTYSVL
ncbi:PREDICTED: lipopolysaccharide-induced tumor necrosis factor-alpha factor homolog [Papilio polytes]|uniref:lipopolysaccharide-induced tumor necrosis factor-alpha factor homolog n=1 Tax=Papilio polytes TaxID=76194 RepID=UPI0006762FB7|nr:PREDICTED: lipopolysaccharide-induced tumor necrosis factor-alpha factor homolog [Papilio polytes]